MCSACRDLIEREPRVPVETKVPEKAFENDMRAILLADIGGSKSRFALAGPSGRLTPPVVIDNDTVDGLEAAIALFLEAVAERPGRASLAVAGPINGEEIALTNRPWRSRRGLLVQRFGFSELRVLNDFEAIAWALPQLEATQLLALGGAGLPFCDGVKLVIGPGTGLGVAALMPAGGRWHVLPSEGGHSLFGPQLPDEFELFAGLAQECGSVCAETILSGRGLLRLHRMLAPSSAEVTCETLVAQVLAGEPTARSTIRMFLRLFGRFAGSMALTFKATGGVYLTGGVARALGPLLDAPEFRAAFEAHPPYEPLLAAIPTALITCPEPGLIGCAAAANSSSLVEAAI
jgi:glucokinase